MKQGRLPPDNGLELVMPFGDHETPQCRHLRYEPGKVSRSSIKRLRGITHPQHRLRAGEIRVFYDITGHVVEILAIVPKSEAVSWLEEIGD